MKTFVQISITNKCNFSCSYCPMLVNGVHYRNDIEHPDKITFGNLTKYISKYFDKNEVYIEITGGEPTLNPDYNKIAEWLDANNYIWLTKSNGTKPARHQISAWHKYDEFPKFYDKILIVKSTPNWEEKEDFCKNNNIPYKVIGFNNECLREPSRVRTLFITSDGFIRKCNAYQVNLSHIDELKEPEYGNHNGGCLCKVWNDFEIFMSFYEIYQYK